MTEDLTPKHLKCGFGSCPSVHRLDDGTLVVVAEFAHMHAPGTAIGDLYDSLEQKVGENEAIVVISPDLLGTLIEEMMLEKLSRPEAVHLNMLRGTIAKISLEQCAHAHGIDVDKWRCADCKSYEHNENGDGYGHCARWERGYADRSIGKNEAWVENDEGWCNVVGPEFGCVLFDAKASSPSQEATNED